MPGYFVFFSAFTRAIVLCIYVHKCACFGLPAFTLAGKSAAVRYDAYPLVNAVVVFAPAVVAVESVAVGVAPLASACFVLLLFAVLRGAFGSLLFLADLFWGADLVFLRVRLRGRRDLLGRLVVLRDKVELSVAHPARLAIVFVDWKRVVLQIWGQNPVASWAFGFAVSGNFEPRIARCRSIFVGLFLGSWGLLRSWWMRSWWLLYVCVAFPASATRLPYGPEIEEVVGENSCGREIECSCADLAGYFLQLARKKKGE